MVFVSRGGQRHGFSRALLLLLAVACALIGLPWAASAATKDAAELRIFADPGDFFQSHNATELVGHAFISVRNTSRGPLTVGKATVRPGEELSIGKWPNGFYPHTGVWYNLEAGLSGLEHFPLDMPSIMKKLTFQDVSKLTDYIVGKPKRPGQNEEPGQDNKYDLFSDNCATFAAGAWNLFVNNEILKIRAITPLQVYGAINANIGGHENGHAQSLRVTSDGVTYWNGSKLTAPGATGGTSVIAENSKKCIDVTDGAIKNGTEVQQWECSNEKPDKNGFPAVPQQKWTLDGGVIRVFWPDAHKCLDADAHSVSRNGTTVQIWDCTGGDNQKWNVMADGTIRSQKSGRCLDVRGSSSRNGARIQLWDCTGKSNQKWSGLPATTTPTTTTPPSATGSKWDRTYTTTDRLLLGGNSEAVTDITRQWKQIVADPSNYVSSGASATTTSFRRALTNGQVGVSQQVQDWINDDTGAPDPQYSVVVCWTENRSLSLVWQMTSDLSEAHGPDGGPAPEILMSGSKCVSVYINIETHGLAVVASGNATATSLVSAGPLYSDYTAPVTVFNYFVQTDSKNYPTGYAGPQIRTTEPKASAAVPAAQTFTSTSAPTGTTAPANTTTGAKPAAIAQSVTTTTSPPPPPVTTTATPPVTTTTRETTPGTTTPMA